LKLFSFLIVFAVAVFLFIWYQKSGTKTTSDLENVSSLTKIDSPLKDSSEKKVSNQSTVLLENINVDSLINFAKSLIGTPYVYASSDPAVGFDCSGFITYVFNHFGMDVPRSSKDFEDEGITILLKESKRGDLILFTGTDSTERFVGHMGIIENNNSEGVSFIHSTSGKAHGVTITQLNDYYMGRFVKVVRIIK
jgi:cell wall-associated NlpC family hydrolase